MANLKIDVFNDTKQSSVIDGIIYGSIFLISENELRGFVSPRPMVKFSSWEYCLKDDIHNLFKKSYFLKKDFWSEESKNSSHLIIDINSEEEDVLLQIKMMI